MRLLAVLAVAIGFVVSPQAPTATETNRLLEELREMVERRRVNDNWSADCATDNVTMVRRCFASTFGQSLRGDDPFQIYYLNEAGPFVRVGFHNYPGREPLIRFDNDPRPFVVSNDGGVSMQQTDPAIVRRLMTATTAIARYHTWPRGHRDMTLDVTGFAEAHARLMELVDGAVAPLEQRSR